MARQLSLLAALGLVLFQGGCGGARPPAELSGLWSAGDGACAAGVGVRFDPDAIAAIYATQRETLFERPIYAVESEASGFRVRIRYELPHRPGGVRAQGAHGVLVLERAPGGGLRVVSHNLMDPRTGAARARISEDPAETLLRLVPCGAHPWREQLRGRAEV